MKIKRGDGTETKYGYQKRKTSLNDGIGCQNIDNYAQRILYGI